MAMYKVSVIRDHEPLLERTYKDCPDELEAIKYMLDDFKIDFRANGLSVTIDAGLGYSCSHRSTLEGSIVPNGKSYIYVIVPTLVSGS